MKYVTFANDGHERPGVLIDDRIFDLVRAGTRAGRCVPATLLDIIAGGDAVRATVDALVEELGASPDLSVPLNAVHLMSPIPRPRRNILCVGRNYLDHVREGFETVGAPVALPDAPQFFTKATGAMTGPFDPIRLDNRVTRRLDYEAELAVIIGKPGRDIATADALDHVFGYAVCNDVSARDLQKRHDQWFKGKSLDGTFPFGPWIVDAAEIGDPSTLELSLSINGDQRQRASIDRMIFAIPKIIASLSAGMTLEAGDIIATGTPEGVGFAMNPRQWLADGDLVVTEIDRIGRIENRVVAVAGG